MTSAMEYSKDILMSELDSSWTELNSLLDSLTPDQLANTRDAEGWSTVDHLNHIAAWERSVVSFLNGKPRYEGLGVDRDLYMEGDENAMNAAVQKKTSHLTQASSRETMRETHQQLLDIIEPMSDSDLKQTMGNFSTDKDYAGDERILLGLIYSNSAQHYREHAGWIKTLVGAA